ncbi:MAG: gamma-glutamyltransferase [Chloroflexi bacterium]|nr:gamma-glutamyltransferase [Chloroflexota bacterium]
MKAWSLDHAEIGLGGKRSFRPTVMGTNGMVASGHYLSTLAGVQVLLKGGNAIDAGVAAAVAGCVVQSDMVSFGGVASIHVYRADRNQSFTVAGVGHWPELARLEYFREHCGGHVPDDVRNGVVPGAPDAYLTALDELGTWTFGRCIRRAYELAVDGFPMYPFRYVVQKQYEQYYRNHLSTREVLMPEGRLPEVGEIFRQPDLGRTLRLMADAEASAWSRDRAEGIDAARQAFYQGATADLIDSFYSVNGGFLRKRDLADYQVTVDPPIVGRWNGYEVRTCPFWSKGPMLIQILNVLEGDDLRALGHNSPEYIHLVAEALKLAFADRHAYYGDPLLVDVPADGLLSKEYACRRRVLIDPERAWSEMPPAGDPRSGEAVRGVPVMAGGSNERPLTTDGAGTGTHRTWPPRQYNDRVDTSHLSVIDRWGNAFGCTFSDPPSHAPITPGTGLVVSNRGVQAWADPEHPNRVRPGQRMVMTGNPAMAFKDGELVLSLGSPGSDVQIQAMTQVFLNMLAFGMDAQEAVEAPRFATYSHPSSFEPHDYHPGVLRVEARVPEETRRRLTELGHRVETWPAWHWPAGGICAVGRDPRTGVLSGGADTRRENYAIGW